MRPIKKSAQICWFFSLLNWLCLLLARVLVGEWLPYFWIPLGLFLVFTVFAVLLDWAWLQQSLRSYRLQRLLKISLRAFVFAALLIVIGAVLQGLDWRMDLSSSGINRLDKQSLAVLEKIQTPVRLIGFFADKKDEQTLENFRRLATKLQKHNALIEIEILKANAHPDRVEAYGIKQLPSLVIASEQRKLVIQQWTEDALINAMLRSLKQDDIRLCLLTDLDGIPVQAGPNDRYQLSQLSAQMEGLGYRFTNMDLVDFLQDASPCRALLLAGIKRMPPESLWPTLERFLNDGKAILVFHDPGKAYGIASFLKKYGIQYYNDYIIDIEAQTAGLHAATALVGSWNQELNLGRELGNRVAVFPVVSRLEISEEGMNGFRVQALGSSSVSSFAVTELKEKIEFQPEIHAQGPFVVAAMAEKEKARLVVVGDSDFLTDEYFAYQGNHRFATSLISYAVTAEGEVSIPPKNFYRQLFILTPTYAKYFLILGVFPLPFLLLALSSWLWFQRTRYQ